MCSPWVEGLKKMLSPLQMNVYVFVHGRKIRKYREAPKHMHIHIYSKTKNILSLQQ